ncbi:MAG: hypothetical protein SFU25_02895, partial [Candidatus Caenarcaniphilales bacterium]|nr:hypothetical protein [Candidatus Caenarcaniphilales bacterium]
PVVIIFSDFTDLILSKVSIIKVLCIVLFFLSIYLVLRSLQIIFEKLFNFLKQKFFKQKWLLNEYERLHNLIERFNIIEIGVIIFVLFILFGLAWFRGFTDGTRDLYKETSILPTVKLISGAETLVKEKQIDSKEWRLLHRHDDWIYLVEPKVNESEAPPKVLLVTKGESGDKILELKPN